MKKGPAGRFTSNTSHRCQHSHHGHKTKKRAFNRKGFLTDERRLVAYFVEKPQIKKEFVAPAIFKAAFLVE